MIAESQSPQNESEQALAQARAEFRRALLQSHERHDSVGDLEAAAARFCQALRREGQPPERMLVDAKRVIEDAIDGDDVSVAERAVRSCIQHYFRP
jgi:hypothetical protein